MNAGRKPRDEEIRLWQTYLGDVVRLPQRQIVASASPPTVYRPPEPRRGAVLDLHGLTTAEAHAAFCAFVAGSIGVYQHVTVVTGTGGVIRREFDHWLATRPEVRRAESLPGGGAFRLHLRKLGR
jgi:hypothetical protein